MSLLSPARGHLGGEPASPAVFCCPRGSSAHIADPAPRTSPRSTLARTLPCGEPRRKSFLLLPGGRAREKRQTARRFVSGPGEEGPQGRHRAGFSPSPAGGGKEGEEREPPALERVLTGARVSPPLWKGHRRSSILPSFLPTGRQHS